MHYNIGLCRTDSCVTAAFASSDDGSVDISSTSVVSEAKLAWAHSLYPPCSHCTGQYNGQCHWLPNTPHKLTTHASKQAEGLGMTHYYITTLAHRTCLPLLSHSPAVRPSHPSHHLLSRCLSTVDPYKPWCVVYNGQPCMFDQTPAGALQPYLLTTPAGTHHSGLGVCAAPIRVCMTAPAVVRCGSMCCPFLVARIIVATQGGLQGGSPGHCPGEQGARWLAHKALSAPRRLKMPVPCTPQHSRNAHSHSS